MFVILPSPIPKLQHAPLSPKCCEPGNVLRLLAIPLFSTSNSHLNPSRSLRACHKCINNVESCPCPHFIIIRTFIVDHTYIGLCKYWDIHIIVLNFPQRPPLITFCDIFLRYSSFVEAYPLCKSCRNFGYNSNCLHHSAKGVCICKQYFK
jgi:hypothetical protein